MAPAGAPLPANVFRGYKSQDFRNVVAEGSEPTGQGAPAPASKKRVPQTLSLRTEDRSPFPNASYPRHPTQPPPAQQQQQQPVVLRVTPPTAPRSRHAAANADFASPDRDASPTQDVFGPPSRRVHMRGES
jgi:hypothetical protein